jgi:hypothetical protein
MFNCEKCGLRGEYLVCILIMVGLGFTNLMKNDGSHQIECERCHDWQHSKCHNINPEIAERDDFVFLCTSCKHKEKTEKEPKLPPLKLRLTSASPNSPNISQVDGEGLEGSVRQLEAVRIPVHRPSVAQSPPRLAQRTSTLMDGPSLSPRGQALGPPGIQRSEAAYGSPLSHANGSSPVRPRPMSHGVVHTGSGYPTSSPPRYRNPALASSPLSTHNASFTQPSGNPFNSAQAFQSAYEKPSTMNDLNRPTSASGPPQSPTKNSPAPSPRLPNGVPNAYNFNSPHSSFPPSALQMSALSPTKHSSPPPPMHPMSSPAPGLMSQMPAQVLPDPIPAPSKHDAALPTSSHDSERMVLPPIESLPPSTPFQDLSPPIKKASPTPNRPQFTPISSNGVGGR